ncbi:MAG: alpha/beta fold hydrolase [Alphaproteobacteria bacterium]|nr:alpha/beta fold hydrolase [Alphaproteobacteria bacterium]
MNAAPSRWRRLAGLLVQHASWVWPGAGPWAEAMRHELDYIEDDGAALRWAMGGLLASYRTRLVDLLCLSTPAAFRYVGVGSVLVLAIGSALMGQASGQPLRPVFDETVCNLPGVSPDIAPRLHCGTIRVPRNYDDPAEGQFKLAVVVVKSAQQPALPDPVVYISGGPGSPLTIYADQQARTLYAAGRDVILVDQRGTGRSEPKLCPDLDRAFLDAAVAVATDPSGDPLAKRRAVYAACRAEALAHGFDLKDFGTRVTVADFEWVRRALGIDRWNVYGISYGTTVAMTLVALHPDTVRAAVLDSLYPPDPRPMFSANVADALAAFFRYCSGDQACAAGYPDLAATYRETLSGLAGAPLVVTVPPEVHVPDDRVSLTSTLFEVLVGQLIYYPSAYPSLPRLIVSVHDRDTRGLGKVLASAAMAAEANRSTYIAVECRDRPHYRDPLSPGASLLDRLQLYGFCNDWSKIGPAPLVPIRTAVPTLVLAGEFDPVTRPSQSRHVAATIGPKARWVEFPRMGHNVSTPRASNGRAFSPCGAKIAADFIDNPAQSLDTSCADRGALIRFLPK